VIYWNRVKWLCVLFAPIVAIMTAYRSSRGGLEFQEVALVLLAGGAAIIIGSVMLRDSWRRIQRDAPTWFAGSAHAVCLGALATQVGRGMWIAYQDLFLIWILAVTMTGSLIRR
jgi:hypothetical protein